MSKKSTFIKKRNYRTAGESRTLLMYPLHYTCDETDIETFISSASHSKPLRLDLFCPRPHTNTTSSSTKQQQSTYDDSYNGYVFITFDNPLDPYTIQQKLNNTKFKNHKINIMYSRIPRFDLENQTNSIELITYPALKNMKLILNFFKLFKQDMNNDNKSYLIPLIRSIPYVSEIRGKWFLEYKDNFIAKQSMLWYTGRYYNNSFIVFNYVMPRHNNNIDRRECFYGISNRIVLYNLSDNVKECDIKEFIGKNMFDKNVVKDMHMIYENKSMAIKNNKKHSTKTTLYKPKPNYCILTLTNINIASKMYTKLNDKKLLTNNIITGFYPDNRQPKISKWLNGKTNWLFIKNLPSNINENEIKLWLKNIKYNKNNNNINTEPETVIIEYIGGYCEGKIHCEFITNKDASIVFECLNGEIYKGRKVMIDFQINKTKKNRKVIRKREGIDDVKEIEKRFEDIDDENVYLKGFLEEDNSGKRKNKFDEPVKKKFKKDD